MSGYSSEDVFDRARGLQGPATLEAEAERWAESTANQLPYAYNIRALLRDQFIAFYKFESGKDRNSRAGAPDGHEGDSKEEDPQ